MRVVAAAELGAAWSVVVGQAGRRRGWAAVVVPLAAGCSPRSPCSGRSVRPLPAEGADVPVDEALRTWTGHLVAAAASVLACCRWAPCCWSAGIDLGDRVTESVDLLPVALVAGGFSALAAGVAVAGFLLTWLRPVRADARALAG